MSSSRKLVASSADQPKTLPPNTSGGIESEDEPRRRCSMDCSSFLFARALNRLFVAEHEGAIKRAGRQMPVERMRRPPGPTRKQEDRRRGGGLRRSRVLGVVGRQRVDEWTMPCTPARRCSPGDSFATKRRKNARL